MDRIWKYFVVVVLAFILGQEVSSAQLFRRNRNRTEPPKDTSTVVLPDSVIARQRADSVARRDSLDMLEKSSLDRPAFSTAKDSIITEFTGGQRKVYYYGGATVTYQDMTLTADYIEYDMKTNTVYARGRKDEATGEWTGQPEMTQGKATYKMEELRYNFDSRKARITNMITQESEGLLQGEKIKMMPDQSVNMQNGVYTVCDLEHPHYYMKMTMAKVVTQPSQKTVFGPAYPVIADVPLPIGLPFGFVPSKPTRATGLLMPTFGEEVARGFFVKDAGMYFVLGDYFDLSLTGSYFTLGSFGVDINSRYKVNYRFNGGFSLNYSRDQTGEKGGPDFVRSTNFGLKWTHSQDAKAHPGTTFSASVNFSSPSNSRYNARSVDEALQNQIGSSISYSHNWNGKVSLSVNAIHSQNSRDSSYNFQLPNVSLSVTRFYPFKRKNRVGKEKAYEKISFGYSTSFQNRLDFKMRELQDFVYNADGSYKIDSDRGVRAKEFGDSLGVKALEHMKNGMSHNFQIGLPNFTLLKYLNFTPSISYGMNWMFNAGRQYLEAEYDADGNPVMVNDENGNLVQAQRVVSDAGHAFNTFGMTHNYSGGISMSTRLYGMFNFGKHHKIQAIRHVITPSISMNYSPEKGKAFNGYRMLDGYYDKRGTWHKESLYNIYSVTGNHNNGGAPSPGKSGSMSFSLGNNIEAKVRDLRDTTGTGSKKVKILDQLTFGGSYNFLADSLRDRMSTINVSASTNLFNKVNLSGGMTLDPLAIDGKGQRANKFNIVDKGVPVRLTRANLSASISFNGKGTINGNDGKKSGEGSGSSDAGSYRRIYYHPVTGEYIPGGYLYYMNPNAPWSLSFSYRFDYNKSYQYTNNQLLEKKNFTQTISCNGNIKLTPRLNISASSGFDFTAMKLTTTSINANYDLHCFNIAVTWVPTGMYKSYSFRIAANASALADLLRFKKSSSYMDNMLTTSRR
ncbi:MAG: hypothetical protein IKV62_10925 [Bacteroidales bacterium]|nr:hypothetical protein [Bacteroidales bacterium]